MLPKNTLETFLFLKIGSNYSAPLYKMGNYVEIALWLFLQIEVKL